MISSCCVMLWQCAFRVKPQYFKPVSHKYRFGNNVCSRTILS